MENRARVYNNRQIILNDGSLVLYTRGRKKRRN